MGVVGLVGCGGQTSTTAAATATATVAAATATATVAAATAPPSPLSSPVVGGICTLTPVAFDPDSIDLTGAWAGNDGGIYYVRQLDSVIWWNGMSSRDQEPTLPGREWNNVGRGEISEDSRSPPNGPTSLAAGPRGAGRSIQDRCQLGGQPPDHQDGRNRLRPRRLALAAVRAGLPPVSAAFSVPGSSDPGRRPSRCHTGRSDRAEPGRGAASYSVRSRFAGPW